MLVKDKTEITLQLQRAWYNMLSDNNFFIVGIRLFRVSTIWSGVYNNIMKLVNK